MLSLSVICLLISNAVTLRRDKSILFSRASMLILVSCFLLCFNSFYLNFFDLGLGLLGGLYHASVISHVFQIFVFIITFVILQLNSFHPIKVIVNKSSGINDIAATDTFSTKLKYFNFLKINRISQQYKIIEYPLIILFVLTGGVFLMSSSDYISIFLCIELQSYALYILSAIYRDSERAMSGALTYFLLGGLSSCFILLASGLLYSNSGNTGFDGLYVIKHISNVDSTAQEPLDSVLSYLYDFNYINFSLVIMSIGFLFKISAAPFHFWSPDVYDAIPTIVTTFVAIFAKISILVLLLELVRHTSNLFLTYKDLDPEIMSQNTFVNDSWTFTFLISSLLSLIIGSVLGLTQFRIKRLYAYSTISHLGFILLALTINTVESIQSFIFYLMQYSLVNLNAFILLIAIGYYLYQYSNKHNLNETGYSNQMSDRNNSPVQLLTDLKGFFHINPILSLSLAITLFSFVGVPPLIGFFAKQMVLVSALDNGYVFMALIAILTSVISAVYYLFLIRLIFFDKADYTIDSRLSDVTMKNKSIDHSLHLTDNLTGTISLLTLMILLFMLAPQEWLNITTIISLIIFNC